MIEMKDINKIKIRKITMGDARDLLPLVNQLGYPTTEENLIARIALYQQSMFDRAWVAIENGHVMGFIALHVYDLFHSTERYARIVSLIVRDTHRRQGIGRRLILKAERYASTQNCSSLELSSSHKRIKQGTDHFYEALGYKNEGEYASNYLRKFLRPKEGPLL
jgi:GNAT superfamily N-acetyltransferase